MAFNGNNLLYLIVDTVPEMRRALTATLNSMGANRVDFAGRMGEAISRIEANAYDVILSEFDLGNGLDGIHLLEEAKHRNLLKQSCVYMICTSEGRATKVISAVELAPDDYLLKPFSGEQLAQRLERAVHRKHAMKCVDDAILAREYHKAIQECERQIAAQSEYTLDFMKLRARLLLTSGAYAAAHDAYQAILALKPLPWAKLGLGKTLYFLKDYAGAVTQLEEVLAHSSKVMEAYDWLAKAQAALGEPFAAQDTLQHAITVSPLVVERQKSLGQVAHRNGHLDAAEGAYRKTVDLAKYSFRRDPELYANLSQVQLDKGDAAAAAKTVGEIRREFKQNRKAELLADVMEGQVAQQMGQEERAKALLAQASQVYDEMEADLPDSCALTFARACYELGDDATGKRVTASLVKKHHDQDELLRDVQSLYQQLGREAEVASLIETTRHAADKVSHEAERLQQAGDHDGALRALMRAAQDMPNSVQVVSKAFQALLEHVALRGWNEEHMASAREYLARIRKLDPQSGRFQKLAELYRNTANQYGVKGNE